MSKVKGNKASNPLSPHSPKTRASGSVVNTSQNSNKGGFRPDPNTTVLGTVNF
jgi:hypothetical protein